MTTIAYICDCVQQLWVTRAFIINFNRAFIHTYEKDDQIKFSMLPFD